MNLSPLVAQVWVAWHVYGELSHLASWGWVSPTYKPKCQVHFNPRVNPFTWSENKSVSGVGASAWFTQRASRTESYLWLGRYIIYITKRGQDIHKQWTNTSPIFHLVAPVLLISIFYWHSMYLIASNATCILVTSLVTMHLTLFLMEKTASQH